MNEIEELEAADTAACRAYIDADLGVNTARDAREAAHKSLEVAMYDLDMAVINRDDARANMFSAASALDRAIDYEDVVKMESKDD